jgi:4,5-dihydroxyphthalate decarboxylase
LDKKVGQTIRVIMQSHDFLHPLLCGDIAPDDPDLRIERGNLRLAQTDPEVVATELSLARHVNRISRDDHSWVAIPAFVRRGFSHRSWFVKRDSTFHTSRDLTGKRVGTNEYLATGNTWSRAAARDQGLDVQTLEWTIGSIDGGSFSTTESLPSNARYAPNEEALVDLLVRGELDALMCPDPPKGFYEPDNMVVRLLPDYRNAEREFFRRTRVYPAYHIVGIRQATYDKSPNLALSIYRTLEKSQHAWTAERLYEGDTSPWLLADLEETMSLMGAGWQHYGEKENAAMLTYFCGEMHAQGLIQRLVRPEELFTEFASLAEAVPATHS